jgi:hypothetical protein
MKNLKENKLQKTICIRVTEEQYNILSGNTRKEKVHVSKQLRNLINAVLEITKEKNNVKN